MQALIQSRFGDLDTVAPVVGITAVAYVSLEVINHLVLQSWFMPWIATFGWSATVVSGIYYGALALSIGLVAWGIYKLFGKQSE